MLSSLEKFDLRGYEITQSNIQCIQTFDIVSHNTQVLLKEGICRLGEHLESSTQLQVPKD